MSAAPLLDSTVAKVTRRLLPFLLLMYVLSFLDRANIGFAKKAFQLDTGLSDAAYAFGAGVFFLSYAVFEVPSNLIMHKVGARIWMCRIMVTWGLISAAMMFAHSETTFYVLRFLLGAAEAGFFPGVILYLTYWIPAYSRGRVMGLFYFGAPIAFIFGGPLSGLLLELEGVGGLTGWQWMFLVEGLLASVVGVWAYWYLDDRPKDAAWLTAEEKTVLGTAIDAEEEVKHAHGPKGLLSALGNPRLLYLCAIYFLIQMSVYGVVFYLPTQVAGLLGTNVGFTVGLVTAIPWICAVAAAYLIPRYSDRTGERRDHGGRDAHRGGPGHRRLHLSGLAVPGACGALLRRRRLHRRAAAVLDLPHELPRRCGRRRRHRPGQLTGCFGRLRRPQRQDLGGRCVRVRIRRPLPSGPDHLFGCPADPRSALARLERAGAGKQQDVGT